MTDTKRKNNVNIDLNDDDDDDERVRFESSDENDNDNGNNTSKKNRDSIYMNESSTKESKRGDKKNTGNTSSDDLYIPAEEYLYVPRANGTHVRLAADNSYAVTDRSVITEKNINDKDGVRIIDVVFSPEKCIKISKDSTNLIYTTSTAVRWITNYEINDDTDMVPKDFESIQLYCIDNGIIEYRDNIGKAGTTASQIIGGQTPIYMETYAYIGIPKWTYDWIQACCQDAGIMLKPGPKDQFQSDYYWANSNITKDTFITASMNDGKPRLFNTKKSNMKHLMIAIGKSLIGVLNVVITLRRGIIEDNVQTYYLGFSTKHFHVKGISDVKAPTLNEKYTYDYSSYGEVSQDLSAIMKKLSVNDSKTSVKVAKSK